MRTLLEPFYSIPTVDIAQFLEDHEGDVQGAMRDWAGMLRAAADGILDVARVIKGKKIEIVPDESDWSISFKGLDEKTEAELSQINVIEIEGLEKHTCPDCGREKDVFDDENPTEDL